MSSRTWERRAYASICGIHAISPVSHGTADVACHLAAHNGAHIAHQPLRLAQFTVPNGLVDDQKEIVDLVIQILRPKLAPQVIADTFGKDGVQTLHAGRVRGPDSLYQAGP